MLDVDYHADWKPLRPGLRAWYAWPVPEVQYIRIARISNNEWEVVASDVREGFSYYEFISDLPARLILLLSAKEAMECLRKKKKRR